MDHSGDILLIEDHRDIAELVFEFLEGQGYSVDYAADGNDGFRLGRENTYDAVVLDVMLPGMDGMALCRALRAARIDTPLLMLTARDALQDKLAGFESGADDYLVKPFDLEELGARLNALIRRQRGGAERLQVGDLTLDPRTLQVERAGEVLNPTPIGLKILATLMQASPRVVDRHTLERAVWGDLPPDSDALRSHMYSLRKVVDRPFGKALIRTVHSAGFRIADSDDE